MTAPENLPDERPDAQHHHARGRDHCDVGAAALNDVLRNAIAAIEAPDADLAVAQNQRSPARILQIVARPKSQKRL